MYEILLGRSPLQRKKFGLRGAIFIGKNYVKMERTVSLANPVYLDVANPHVILVCGKRGSGKSYTLGVVAEGMFELEKEISQNLSALIFDTMGIFWTMKYPNYRDDALLSKWGLRPKALSPIIWVPAGQFDRLIKAGLPADRQFAISWTDLRSDTVCKFFGVSPYSTKGLLIAEVFGKPYKKMLDSLAKSRASGEDKKAVKQMIVVLNKLGLFSDQGTNILDLCGGGNISILDLSAYAQYPNGDVIKALVIGIVCNKIFEHRMFARKAEEIKLISEGGFVFGSTALTEKRAPLVWIFIDEAHEFIPNKGDTLASPALIRLLREGRQPGISLVLATQQPGKIHTDVMTQSDIVISHRLTSEIDIDALNLISASYLPKKIREYFADLPPEKGAALIIDDRLEKMHMCQIRPRYSWHGGEDPSAIRRELTKFGLI